MPNSASAREAGQVSTSPVFIDAFAGCGGLSLGLMNAGWNGLFAIEKDEFAFETLAANLVDNEAHASFAWPEWLPKKATTLEALIETHRESLVALRGKVDLLAGGPPCQGFSSAGRRRPSDPRNKLVERYLEFVDLVEPRIVLVENVRGITYDFAGKDEPRNFAAELISRLGKSYHVYSETLRAAAYGVPQNRPRFFLIALLKSRFGELAGVVSPFRTLEISKDRILAAKGLSACTTSREALSDLELAFAGKRSCTDTRGYEAIATAEPRNAYQRLMREDFQGTLSDTRLAKHREHIGDRFARIIAQCKLEGRLNVGLNREMREQYSIKKMATRVLDPDKPAPTITSMPDDLLHYDEPRTLTVRENARLQTFPDWFSFKGKYTTGGERRAREVPRFTQVANAVPPLLAELIGRTLLGYLDASSGLAEKIDRGSTVEQIA